MIFKNTDIFAPKNPVFIYIFSFNIMSIFWKEIGNIDHLCLLYKHNDHCFEKIGQYRPFIFFLFDSNFVQISRFVLSVHPYKNGSLNIQKSVIFEVIF